MTTPIDLKADVRAMTLGADFKTEAQHVLFFLKEVGGIEPGGFIKRLLDAMFHADANNLRKFAISWPKYYAMVVMYKYESGGADYLRRLAKSQDQST